QLSRAGRLLHRRPDVRRCRASAWRKPPTRRSDHPHRCAPGLADVQHRRCNVTDETDKEPPERLELRARPRPIRRLNRRALMMTSAVAALFIAGATIIALNPPHMLKSGERTELYNTDRKQTAEGLFKLPKSYDDLPPKLGPPSPGDVGRAFVESEKKLG